jgi:large subunit ribosomal protein L15
MNKLALKVHCHPEAYPIKPKFAAPPPKLMRYYLDYSRRGYLSPEIQLKRQLRKLGLPSS